MHLEIVTHKGIVFSSNVEVGTFPGVEGSFQVLENHAGMISLLKKGVVELKRKEDVVSFSIMSGIVEVNRNKVTLLAEDVVIEQ